MDRAQSINLTWADIDFERGRIHVRNRAATPELPPFTVKADGRGGPSKARSVPIPKPVADALAAWQADASEGVPFVFMTAERFEQVKRNWTRCQAGLPREGSQKPRPWENRDMAINVLRECRRHLKQSSVTADPPMTLHAFRKSFGQNHAYNGTPIHVLQQLMGHSSVATTREFYIHGADANTQAATDRYEELLSPEVAETACVEETDARVIGGLNMGIDPAGPMICNVLVLLGLAQL